MKQRNIHGDYTIDMIDGLIRVKFIGQSNKEMFIELDEHIKRMVIERSPKPWGVICDIREWGLNTPECWNEVGMNTADWLIEHNQQFEALVCASQLQKHLANQRISYTPQIPVKVFSMYNEAMDWCDKFIKTWR
ncbi:hypothetical protein L4C34_11965 [Vibrio profundum]|uniref:STAS/SEC14 domain-containing protein n=1 Tax=Vibrio profundum TaxID=2910247 RepID=UPI003D0EC27B